MIPPNGYVFPNDPYAWETIIQDPVYLPSLKDRVVMATASEFGFLSNHTEWLSLLAEATLTKLHAH